MWELNFVCFQSLQRLLTRRNFNRTLRLSWVCGSFVLVSSVTTNVLCYMIGLLMDVIKRQTIKGQVELPASLVWFSLIQSALYCYRWSNAFSLIPVICHFYLLRQQLTQQRAWVWVLKRPVGHIAKKHCRCSTCPKLQLQCKYVTFQS